MGFIDSVMAAARRITKTTADGAKKGAEKAAPVVKDAAKGTANAAKKGAQKAAPVVKDAAKGTANAAKKGADRAKQAWAKLGADDDSSTSDKG